MLNVFNVVAIYYYNIARAAPSGKLSRRGWMMHYHISYAIIYRLLLLAYIYCR